MKMLLPIIKFLNTKRVVLASSSPRRNELLKSFGLKFEVCASTFEENLDIKDFDSFSAFVEETAKQKVIEVTNRLNEIARAEGKPLVDVVIGADTMVVLGNEMYGKPKTPQKAIETLEKLSGKTNVVYTGVVIKFGDHIETFTDSTEVIFQSLTAERISYYVNTGEPLDKAGSFSIQDIGSILIERINGDYNTVVGLPVGQVVRKLETLKSKYEIQSQ